MADSLSRYPPPHLRFDIPSRADRNYEFEVAGHRIQIVLNMSTYRPVLEVSESCPMTNAGRYAMNSWLAARFGYTDQLNVLLFKDLVSGTPVIMCNREASHILAYRAGVITRGVLPF